MSESAQNSESRLASAFDHIRAGRAVEAERVYRAAEAAPPSAPAALYTLGRLALKLGRNAAACEWIAQAIRARPDDAEFMNGYGVALRRLERRHEAARAFRLALALDPALAAARHNLRAIENARNAPAFWQDYQVDVEHYRDSPYLDYPHNVQIETMAVCNAACGFCPYVALARKGAKMPMALIEKITDDLTEIPYDLPFTLEPVKVNEPFLDKRLFDILALFRARLPQARIKLTSNGTPLTDRVLGRLEEVETLDRLYISLNDHRPDHYQRTMKLPLARTLARLEALHLAKAAGRLRARVILSRVGDATAADGAFQAWARDRFPLFETLVYERFDWTRQVDVEAIGAVPPVGCQRWFDLSITATGLVALCCIDGHGEHAIGDVSEDHVLAVYNAPSYRALRERAATRAGIVPCESCTYY